MTAPRVLVVVPAHNEEASLPGTLAELPNWRPVEPGPSVWTDDHADVLGALQIS